MVTSSNYRWWRMKEGLSLISQERKRFRQNFAGNEKAWPRSFREKADTGEVTYSKHKQFGRKCKHCSDRKRTSLPTARKKKKKLDIDQKSVQSALATFVMI